MERFCRDALAEHAKLFRLWHKFCDGRIDRTQLKRRSVPIQQRISELAKGNLKSPDNEVRNLAMALFEHHGKLYTFLEIAGVEPTKNSSEQALRIAVQMRKIFLGNRSPAGIDCSSSGRHRERHCKRPPLPYLGVMGSCRTLRQ